MGQDDKSARRATREKLAEADAKHARGDLPGAVDDYLEVLNRDAASVPAWWGLASAFATRGQHAAAVGCLSELIDRAPRSVEAHHNLGRSLFSLGNLDAAIDEFRLAYAIEPNSASLGMLAVLIPQCPRADLDEILETRLAWAKTLPIAGADFGLSEIGEQSLRLGYVSSFFSSRNWMKPVWGLINAHNRTRFEIVLFSDGPLDAIGPEYRRDPRDSFVEMTGRSNDQVAELVKSRKIDILVDLNAFSKFARLPLFAMRPAPVSVEWFALFATSGMTCFDALIGDPTVIRPGDSTFFIEPLVCVPGSYMTFEVGYEVPEVTPPPCTLGEPFTFGCLAPQYKITPDVLLAWGRILAGAAGSRLLLKSTFLQIEGNRDWLKDRMKEAGIDVARVILEGPAEHYAFLEKYAEIDVALDTFPYNGGTTTTEAIWQGVPVLTFLGDRWIGRISASLERNGGLGEFVTENLEGHIRQAITMANDPETPTRLQETRGKIRQRLRVSPVCDVQGFARSMEAIYQELWANRDP